MTGRLVGALLPANLDTDTGGGHQELVVRILSPCQLHMVTCQEELETPS